jgi:phosphatidate cytidylyltransferase
MARWSALDKLPSAWLRVLSALAIAPPVLAAVHFGAPYFDLLILLVACVTTWEWARLCGGGSLGAGGVFLIGLVILAITAGLLASYPLAALLAGAGALAIGLAVGRRDLQAGSWLAAGAVYLTLSSLACLWLRSVPQDGEIVVYWLFATVWATDTGAYVVGRNLGGPKLAPAISPNKTWSGLLGGMLAAAGVGAVASLWWTPAAPWILIASSAGLALVAQAGDLLESYVKRRFGVKDASRLIPGHGGMLDRVDGLLAASLAVGLVLWI